MHQDQNVSQGMQHMNQNASFNTQQNTYGTYAQGKNQDQQQAYNQHLGHNTQNSLLGK